MTNADWIRAMDDVTLADFLFHKTDEDCDYCVYGANLLNGDDDCMCPTDYVDCMGGVLLWLKQEHEDENYTE